MRRKSLFQCAAVACALAVALAGCASARPPADGAGGGESPVTYAEVRTYQGKDLSSISDFVENSIAGPQSVDATAYRLRVFGMVERPRALTYADVLAHTPRKRIVRLDCVEGWSVDILWEGVPVREILSEAGVDPKARTVVFRAVDGYSTSFPVEYVTDNEILLAYKMNDVVLPPERGFPFQVVAEDKWGYKWIKWVESIELTSSVDYRGYWESRGYSNTGDRSRPPFGD